MSPGRKRKLIASFLVHTTTAGRGCSGLMSRGSGTVGRSNENSSKVPHMSPLRMGISSSQEPTEDNDDWFCEVYDGNGVAAYQLLCKNENENDYSRLVRMEKEGDQIWTTVTNKRQIMDKIKETEEIQSKLGPSGLYDRQWEWFQRPQFGSRTSSSVINGASSPYDTVGDVASFSVMQFNMLAEGLSSAPDAKTPFLAEESGGQTEKSAYGGFTDIPHPEATLDFEARRWRLLQVMVGEDGLAPFDIIAMEEIDRFCGFFQPALRLFGYDGIFYPKPRSPGARMGWYSDGCALFWKRDTFELVGEKRFEYKVGNQIMVLMTLRHRATNRVIVVAETHLKAQKNEKSEQIRCSQVEEFLDHVADAVKEAESSNGKDNVPVLLLGDFNADPPTQVDGPMSAISEVLSSRTGRAFHSAYDVNPPKQDFYTTWKIRGTKMTKRIIDYIFHSDKLECEARLMVPPEEALEETKLPGLRYPSDHLAIAARFRIIE